jgi:RsiW-degrading membrane proteinase PrsW (M82 family)
MPPDSDPVERAADDSIDLYDIATWEERTSVDGLAVAIYRLLVGSARIGIILTAGVLLLAVGGFSAVTDPQVGALTVLSAIPALGLAAYVWYSDVTASEPVTLLLATFLLGVLTANFAAVVNTLLQPLFEPLAFAGQVLFFFVVVGPVEESVKLLAVRLYAYRKPEFHAVVDGAVYGAMAGLGFAFIENSLYIAQQTNAIDPGTSVIGMGAGITTIRALAGPGHVIYSAFAGYYLGLAKFNEEHAGPIVIKGLVIAAFIHALYNSTVGIGSGLLSTTTGLPTIGGFFGYVLLFDGLFGLMLIRKIRRYSRAYHRTSEPDFDEQALPSESTEFE